MRTQGLRLAEARPAAIDTGRRQREFGHLNLVKEA